MDFNETVIKRRSLRKFKQDAVPNEVLNRILEAGRWAPSASNLQP
jgi:nitroreductase